MRIKEFEPGTLIATRGSLAVVIRQGMLNTHIQGLYVWSPSAVPLDNTNWSVACKERVVCQLLEDLTTSWYIVVMIAVHQLRIHGFCWEELDAIERSFREDGLVWEP